MITVFLQRCNLIVWFYVYCKHADKHIIDSKLERSLSELKISHLFLL